MNYKNPIAALAIFSASLALNGCSTYPPSRTTYENDKIDTIETSLKLNNASVVKGMIKDASDEPFKTKEFDKIVVTYPNGIKLIMVGKGKTLMGYSTHLDETAALDVYASIIREYEEINKKSVKPEKEPKDEVSAPLK